MKTDRRDARELCRGRYVRGNTEAFSVVRVPTEAQEQAASESRARRAALKERQRCIVRSYGLMLGQGIHAKPGWRQPAVLGRAGPTLSAWLAVKVDWGRGRWSSTKR